MIGIVKWFNLQRGYGFITPEEGCAEIFVHITSLPARNRTEGLLPGDRVTYEAAEGERGMKAVNVRILSRAELQHSK